MKRFLILQLRPEADASDAEYASILDKTGLTPEQTHRIRLDREDLPKGLNVIDYAGVIVGGGPGCVSDGPATKSELDTKIENAVMGLMPQITANRITPLWAAAMGWAFWPRIWVATSAKRVSANRSAPQPAV